MFFELLNFPCEGSAPAEPEEASREKQRRSRHDGGRGTESEVVLDAFLEFCDQYR